MVRSKSERHGESWLKSIGDTDIEEDNGFRITLGLIFSFFLFRVCISSLPLC